MKAWTIAAAIALLAIACSGPAPDSGRLQVTATTGMIADTARKIGGNLVDVHGLMGPGVDPHLYKATQGDLQKLTAADLILFNGLYLEGRMADVLVRMAQRVPTVQVTESIPDDLLREPPEFEGQPDPHVWFDLALWRYVADRILAALVDLDPANGPTYRANAELYFAELDALHAYAQTQIATIPEDTRLLVTAHDAFGYFGDAYGIEVVGLQGISTAAEYGLQDVDRMVDVLVRRGIKAVFVESSISERSIQALITGARAKGHDVRIGGTLYSDALGQAGTPEATLFGAFKHNVDTIVEALR